MKSLLFGIYGEYDESTLSVNHQIFNCQNQRETVQFKIDKLILYFYKGSTDFQVLEVDKYFVFLSGDSDLDLTQFDYNSSDINTLFKLVIQEGKGHFTFGIYDKIYDVLLLSNDCFGLYPLFYRKTSKSLVFSNEYQSLTFHDGNLLDISISKIAPYFEYGFTLPGTTFFDDIHKLKSQQRIKISKQVYRVESYNSFIPKVFENYDQCLIELKKALKNAIDNLFKRHQNTDVSITGGLDSRMILGFTDAEVRSRENYFTFYLDPLDETNDKDVLIGKIIAAEYKLNHTVIPFNEKTENLNPSYFDTIRKDSNRVKITGQYGGEMLSGILFSHIFTKDVNQTFNKLYNPKNKLLKKLSKHKQLNKLTQAKTKKMLYFELLSSAFFSSIYDGTEGSWAHPWMNSVRYFSPFLDAEFLKVWSAIPEKYLFDYEKSLYFDLYTEYLPEFKSIPTNSQLKGLAENGFKSFELGIEPKSIKKSKSSFALDKIEKMKGFSLIPAKFKSEEYLSDKNKQQRLIDFCNWYSYYLTLGMISVKKDNLSKS